jgi:alkylated DNA repair dioxygenase AlkB
MFHDSGIPLDLADGAGLYLPQAFGPAEADRLFATLLNEIAWQAEEIVIFGQRHPVPRLVAWHGDPGARYRYSGVMHEPLPWIPALQEIRSRVENLAACRFNSVLLNRYRHGRDSMGWHADDEPELGTNPVIASVSLGATRRFRMRHRRHRGQTLSIDLEHGSLLVLRDSTQHHWLHAVPKTSREVGERINLTFRRLQWPVLNA